MGNLVDVSDIFYFSARGDGREESEAPGGGLVKIPEGGGGLQEGGEGLSGREGVSAANWGMGGAKYFFFGAEMSAKVRCGFLGTRMGQNT